LLLLGRSAARLEALRRTLDTETVAFAEDLAAGSRLESFAAEFLAQAGGTDALVAAHGAAATGPALSFHRNSLENLLSVNLVGTVRLLQAFLPSMLERGRGIAVVVLSIAARQAFPEWGAYAASKAGLLAWLECLRREIQGKGVRLTALLPGATDTPLWDSIPGTWDRHRMLSPERVAEVVAWLVANSEAQEVGELSLLPPAGVL
jgi:short-subunit dehydrogenase